MPRRIKIKLNFWRIIRNLNRIRTFIEDIIDLYERVRSLSQDVVVKNLINRIEKTLEEVFDYEK